MAEFNRPGSAFTEQGWRPEMGQRPGPEREEAGALAAVSEKARDLASGASQVAGEAKERVQQWASSAADTAEDAWDSFHRVVSRNPVPSLLIAAGIGFLLALAMQNTNILRGNGERQTYR